MKKIALFLFSLFLLTTFFRPVSADELEDIEKQLANLKKEYEQVEKAKAPLESQLKSLERQLAQIQANLNTLSNNITLKQKELDLREDKLVELTVIFNERVATDYKNSFLYSSFGFLLGQSRLSDKLYHLKTVNQNREIIKSISTEMFDLLTQKEKLEKDKLKLASVKAEVDKNANFIGGEVKKASAYQADISSQISALSARQQSILAARSGQFTASIGDSEEADDINASIKGFKANAPAGYFGVFSFGAHTHRKGMSQYGARGRAISGQGVEQILAAYYSGMNLKKDYDRGAQVNVQGHGTFNIEDYVKRIYEVPSSWTENNLAVLKAQAVAARTYALDSMRRNGSICTTEACQVFKPEPKGGNWEQAVNETAGWVLMQGDVPGFTQYASTHGGYASPVGWDTTDGSGGGNFVDKSYDKLGGSPWLYKAWYTKAYNISSDKCGRSNAWLSPEEMADIINATRYRDDRVTPVTTSCYPGTNPYSHSELREKSNGPSTVSSVTVIQGNGSTNEIIFQTNIGEIRVSASAFKESFNIRAPGYLAIPQKGFAFFNIEKK